MVINTKNNAKVFRPLTIVVMQNAFKVKLHVHRFGHSKPNESEIIPYATVDMHSKVKLTILLLSIYEKRNVLLLIWKDMA